uniref:RNA helicase n=1 Tax=Lotharella vacuolata TaxID=74820 RepID=A0A0H5BGY1_9EUKA|nr:putative ATP-dependent RNA helicase CDC28 [Lotharella vacuolata]
MYAILTFIFLFFMLDRNKSKIEKITGIVKLNSRNQYVLKRVIKKIKLLNFYFKGLLPNVKNIFLYDLELINILKKLKLFQLLLKLYHCNIYFSKSEKKKYLQKYFMQKNTHIIKNTKFLKNINLLNNNIRKIAYVPLNKTKEQILPVKKYFHSLMKSINQFDILMIVAETGAGKTTQIPKFLFKIGYQKLGIIGITQPRRLAVINLSRRVSHEMNVNLGIEVGYSIRFEEQISYKTKIKFMTDGILLREVVSEPTLAYYSVIMLDEAHERSVYTDILFSLLKDIVFYRKNFKLLISSATINIYKFSKFFSNAPLFRIPGRLYSVTIFYSKKPHLDYLDSIVKSIMQLHISKVSGDILSFLTGQEDIEIAIEILKKKFKFNTKIFSKIKLFPLYSNLSNENQNRTFQIFGSSFRKVILATNIAETSITIPGIKYVIDAGLCKLKCFNPLNRVDSLLVTPISKISALQRSGRAGRTEKGESFRLYTYNTFLKTLENEQIPEIQRSNIDSLILMLKCLGVNNLIEFEFLDNPTTETISLSLGQLYLLGSINSKGQLTKTGKSMSEIPMTPNLAKILLSSEFYECSEDIVIICSILSLESRIFIYPKKNTPLFKYVFKKFNSYPRSDHISLLNVFKEWIYNNFSMKWAYDNFIDIRILIKAKLVYEQFLILLSRLTIAVIPNKIKKNNSIIKCLCTGLFMNVAKLKIKNTCLIINNSLKMRIHPSSSMIDFVTDWVIFQEIIFTNIEFINIVSEVKIEWVIEIAPLYYCIIKKK